MISDGKDEKNQAAESERTVEQTRIKKIKNTVKYDVLERISGTIKWIIHDLTVGVLIKKMQVECYEKKRPSQLRSFP